jgi:cell wall-associated NlpC family hydrolase
MARRTFFIRLQLALCCLGLCLAVSCKRSFSVTHSAPDTASRFADTDQRKLAWEFKRKVREVKRAERRAARYARTHINRDIEKVIRTARSYRGTPYKYGGTSRIGMDCSGLLCTSFKAINVTLPRNSFDQSQFGREVRPRDLRPGDLVFFGASGGSRHISHVGMITDIKSRDEIYFIHASTSLGVKEDNLYSAHYQKIFIKATRPRI